MGKDGDDAVFTTSFYYDLNEKTRNFTKKFVDGAKKKGIVKPFPHHVDAAAYDIVYVFKKAMEVAKITGDPNKLKEERTAIRDVLGKNQYDLISGKVCFDKNGDAQLPGYILTMKNKQWKLLGAHAPLPQLSLSLKQTLKRGRLGLPLFSVSFCTHRPITVRILKNVLSTRQNKPWTSP